MRRKRFTRAARTRFFLVAHDRPARYAPRTSHRVATLLQRRLYLTRLKNSTAPARLANFHARSPAAALEAFCAVGVGRRGRAPVRRCPAGCRQPEEIVCRVIVHVGRARRPCARNTSSHTDRWSDAERLEIGVHHRAAVVPSPSCCHRIAIGEVGHGSLMVESPSDHRQHRGSVGCRIILSRR